VTRRIAAVVAPVGTSALAVAAAMLGHDVRQLIWIPFIAACCGVGALLWYRHAGGVLGALFLFTGLTTAMNGVTQAYADAGMSHHLPGAAWSAWLFQASIGLTLSILLIVQLFPTGSPVGPRWRWLVWATCAIGVVMVMGPALGATPEFRMNFPRLVHPLQLLSPQVEAVLDNFTGVALLGVFLASAASIVVRYRRSDREHRLQVKWFAAASAIAAIGFVAAFLIIPDDPSPAFALLTPLIPIAAGIAILRYRLYDIDVVISKTVVFGALAAFIALAYVAVVVGLGTLLGNPNDPTLSIAATIAIALLFTPVMAGFSRKVAGTLSVGEVLPEMAEAAGTGVGARVAQVRVRIGEAEHAVRWPADVPAPAEWDRSLEVRHQGAPVGGIDVAKEANDPLTAAEGRLLEDLAAQAGLALHNVRLTDDLALRTRELAEQTDRLTASRQRLVAARDEQRRRLEREISAGPAAELGRIRDELDRVAGMADGDPGGAAGRLETLLGRSNATLEQLRDIARGIFPPLLVDQGVGPALEAHVRKVGANTTVTSSAGFAGRRFDADVEACLYFCCLQAIQNVLRHAGNAPARVRFEVTEGAVTFEVADDGPGFDPSTTEPGMGQAIMRDRIDALDGALEVRSEPGRGTIVEGRVPLRVVAPA
jgi:signal transduction histidine kinase